MNPLMKRFFLRTTILTVLLLLAGYITYTQIIPQHFLFILPIILIFFYLATNLVHFYLLKIADKEIRKFAPRFMAASFIKMMLYMVLGLVIAVLHREEAKVFLANFLILYLCFSIVEVYEISKVVKSKK